LKLADLKKNADTVNFFKSIPFIEHVPKGKISKLPLNMTFSKFDKE
jgi:hypothetical protein